MAHALSAADVDLIAYVLRDNLFLVNNNYIICNVFDQGSDRVEPVCLGEIGAVQAHTPDQDAMLDTSSTSDVPSSTTS
ncbi:late expression factor 10 [Anticarsia gemmatalis nucleopolyhedrovirus]|uniref:Late expression factor 10 n=1 Tax=Anticarsia gemmatalis multiple nucleopolyhedrovirus TaxID=268591 RepID=A0A0S3J1A9_9ABAC|nr:late expression factor 10 [Anticarsia gemmatalis nucleopolyhedrovirus]ABI13838.1 late expression factor 10 [Anticarsia gemmatalis multiple nucleopolyhedrovirus]ALR69913.1 late expression factor 10 [Anticarsia gemmatalis multiple nucleopolyhedrovirus]ALR70228.1 late expression factor 10 [Anticarsia gemmatalis multiple nucleopolyhedrovirus]ALR70541.1 late expression factor 10 [Anticarsia gemmatalis multiple nucleopolyhedrovirus]ALR70698.1 late expression factor 10 [Anticarsia gemmatalis multi